MKSTKIISVLFGLLFIPLLIGTVFLAFFARSSTPLMVSSMTEAQGQTEALMEAVCSRDYAAAESLLSGDLTLTPDREPSNNLSKVLWEAYGNTLSYEFRGDCYATDYGLFRDVTVTFLDIPSIMADIQSHSAVLLANKAIADPNNAYDADGLYREEFVMNALAEEASLLTDSDAYLITRDLTLHLVGDGSSWLIQADQSLMTVLAGGMGGA